MDADLRDLLAAWLGEEDPGEERRTALLDRLRNDEAFRRSFIGEIRLLGMLKVVQSSEPRWLRLEDELGWSAQESATAESLSDRVLAAARPRLRWRTFGRRALAVAAVVLIAVGVIAVLPPGGTPDAQTAAQPEDLVELATAVKLDGVHWDSGEGLQPAEGGIVTAGRLRLRSGRLTLVFFSGVSLAVEGPADLELRTMDRVFCREGKLRARVPSGAEGFTVLAPGYEVVGGVAVYTPRRPLRTPRRPPGIPVEALGYEVVDLGTDFGLNLVSAGPANLMLFEGAAALSLLGPDGHSVRSALVESRKAVEIDAKAARIQEIASQPERFVRLPEVRPQDLELAPNYQAEVLASKPWGYWRFEEVIERQVPNEVAGGPVLHVQGGVRLDGVPGGNHWALFRADDPMQALLMDGEWSPPRGQGYAIEFWVQADALGQNALVSLIDRTPGREENHVALLELTARSLRSPFEPCAVRFLDRWPPGQAGGVNVFSRRTFIPAVWHHVVGQKAEDTLELYIDGRLVASSPAAPLPPEPAEITTPCRLLVGRLKQRPLPLPGQIRPFEGRIDELAVYERPLTVEEIRRHSRRNG